MVGKGFDEFVTAAIVPGEEVTTEQFDQNYMAR
jgi:hypothetical protein